MCTTRMESVHASFSVAWGGVGMYPNEQVWTGLQWSPADVTSMGSPGLMSGKVLYLAFPGGGVPYYVTYPMMHFMLLTPLPMDRQVNVKAIPSWKFVCGRQK